MRTVYSASQNTVRPLYLVHPQSSLTRNSFPSLLFPVTQLSSSIYSTTTPSLSIFNLKMKLTRFFDAFHVLVSAFSNKLTF